MEAARHHLIRPCFRVFKFQRLELTLRGVTQTRRLTFAIAAGDDFIWSQRTPVRGCVFYGVGVGTTDTSPHHSWKR